MIADIVQTGLSSWWAPALAFAAGLVSCLSPCVWPLLPGYLSFITGEQIVGEESGVDRTPLAPMLLFILGFTIVFVLLGAFSSTFVKVFKGTTGQRVGGTIVITFGVLMIGYALRRGSLALYAERRPFLARVRPGSVGAVPLGMAFAAGWTPCIGPVLGAILAIAAGEDSVRQGVSLLLVYSLGLGIPFVLAALAIKPFMRAMQRFRGHLASVEKVLGGFLVLTGILFLTNSMTLIATWMLELFPGLATIG